MKRISKIALVAMMALVMCLCFSAVAQAQVTGNITVSIADCTQIAYPGVTASAGLTFSSDRSSWTASGSGSTTILLYRSWGGISTVYRTVTLDFSASGPTTSGNGSIEINYTVVDKEYAYGFIPVGTTGPTTYSVSGSLSVSGGVIAGNGVIWYIPTNFFAGAKWSATGSITGGSGSGTGTSGSTGGTG